MLLHSFIDAAPSHVYERPHVSRILYTTPVVHFKKLSGGFFFRSRFTIVRTYRTLGVSRQRYFNVEKTTRTPCLPATFFKLCSWTRSLDLVPTGCALATFGVIVALADWAGPTSPPVADGLRRQCSSDLLDLLYTIYRRRQHLSLPFEHTTASSNVGRVQQRQLPRGCSSRGPPSPGSLRWLDTPHAVSVSRGMSGTQQLMLFDHDARVRQAYRRAQWMNQAQRFRIALDMSDPKVQQTMQLAEQPFDFQVGGRAPPVQIAGIDPDEEDDELQEISS
ncbi:uncharacterized protein LOC119165224 isoform X1 [Rhipicephalus microplus]|uniref:uncharacterized protein LOC119165224 isoform X1 n=1 Tax=Rhipicephalus microplus TaxID=6941 RepID=UPI003F6B1CAA